jgi:peptide chain release factor 2
MKVVRELKGWIRDYNEVKSATDELQLAYDFVKDGVVTEEEVDAAYRKAIDLIENLELKNMLRKEEDKLGAVLKINAGAGGTESQDWASMLFRMYQRWCESKNYKTTVTNWQDGDDAGIKTATLQLKARWLMAF